ncbi:GNAT family N-acetyltransferase [Cytophagales bacterium LB-30]|uniref:GNAT family N-acetyltransferase n=1 Tax=Shiella aurantiaca TaxID=3058365 RepID=A0ABT8F7C2_9BACT|nr:GNAT family N-acetyltransferase [Shiella aurantiaca]MDN4166106.1 GNAT family N-acetyltransferase [Shiella aurantiaca]
MNEVPLEFILLTPLNWEQWKAHVLEDEVQYPESLQTSEEEYAHMLKALPNASFVLLYQNQYAGNCIIKCLGAEDWVDLHMEDLSLPEGVYYLHNYSVSGVFQGKGLGQKMFAHLLQHLRSLGVKELWGHFRPNASLNNALKVGAIRVREEPNWYETGETFTLCKIPLVF